MREVYCKVWTKDGSQELTTNEWLLLDNNLLHRIDGPAIEVVSGGKYWFINGKRHRLDGPAIEVVSEYWFIYGKELNTKEVEEFIKENDIDLSTQEGQMAIKLRFS